MSNKIRTRFLLISDTHATTAHPATSIHPFRQPLPKTDVAIHSGDLTNTGTLAEHQTTLSLLTSLPADLKIVIPGNHDITLDTTYYATKGHIHGPRPKYTSHQLVQIRNLYTSPEALAQGIHYLDHGIQTFRLKNGATLTVYATPYTPEYQDWAFSHPITTDLYSVPQSQHYIPTYNDPSISSSSSSRNLDILISHGPPYRTLDLTTQDLHVGCPHLLRAVSRSRPLLHVFGHIHESNGMIRRSWGSNGSGSGSCSDVDVDVDTAAKVQGDDCVVDMTDLERGCETGFVNASIMDVEGRAWQGGWIVDLLLDGCDVVAEGG